MITFVIIVESHKVELRFILHHGFCHDIESHTAEQLLLLQMMPPVPSNPDTHYLMDEANFVKSLQCCVPE